MTSPKTEDVKRGISVLWETLQCPICMELMITPVSTKCNHQFCKFCMAKFLDSRKQKEANCPVCKMKITKRSLQDSPGFQRLIEGLQNMVHAYEQDTCTNYFTGASQQRKQPIVTEPDANKHPDDVSSGDTSDPPGLDSDEDEEHDGLSRSHSSTIAAKDGFARLMGLENSSPFTPENEDLDTGLGDVPQTSEMKMDIFIRSTSPTEVLEPAMETEASEVVEKATSRPKSRSKKRTTKCENPLILSPEVEQQKQPLRKSSRSNKRKNLEPDEILDRRQKKSLEKVSEWLMKIPPTEENPEMENNIDACDSDDSTSATGSCSSTSMAKIKQDDNDESPKREERVKGLEEQVFGAVYKRDRRGTRSFSPKNGVFVDQPVPPLPEEAQITRKIPKKRISNKLSPADFVKRPSTEEKDDSALQDQSQMIEQENDTTTDILNETNQVFIDLNDDSDSNTTHKHGEELDKLSKCDENKGKDVEDSPAFDVVLHQPGRRSKKKMSAPWQDVDADLQEQAKAKPDITEKKGTGKKKSENFKTEKGKSIRVPKPLVLVGVREGESSPVEISKSGPTCGEIEVQIESYPSTQEPGTPVRRSTRRSKRLQLFTEEVRGSHRKTSIPKPTKANIPVLDGNLVKQSEEEEGTKMLDYGTCSQNGKMGKVSKRNGCVYDEDMGGVEKMESSESTSTQSRITKAVTVESIAEVPNTGSPRVANVSCSAAIVQSSRSPCEATVQNPVLESVSASDPVVNSPNIRPNAPLQTSGNHANCEDMEGIENMESGESTSSRLGATKTVTSVQESFAEVPNTGSPCVANVACSVAVVPSSTSPTEAPVPNPALESFSPAIPVVNSPNDMRLNTPQETAESPIKCIALEEDADMNDSEVDTEQLMKSFKGTKRKSFLLGSPTMKRGHLLSGKGNLRGGEILESAHIGSGIQSEKDQEFSNAKECSIVQQEALKELENSTCSDLIPPSDSPSLNTRKLARKLQRGLHKSGITKSNQGVLFSPTPDSNGKIQDSALDGVSRNSVSSDLSPNKEAQSQIASPHLALVPQAIDSGLFHPAFGESEEDLSNLADVASKQSQVTGTQLECSVTKMGVIKQSDLNHSVAQHTAAVMETACAENTVERVANSEASVTPDDLVPVISAVHQATENGRGSGELSAHSPIKSSSRKRRAQRLESSSESDCSDEEEELPPLAEIFRTSACPSSAERESSCLLEDRVQGQVDSDDGDGGEGVCVPADAAEPEGCLPACPSPDSVNSGQASVDLFGTPEECDVPVSGTGHSMESSQFSSEVLATQQKMAMQEELVRLEKMMALVSEVLQEKEDTPMAQVPSESPLCQQSNKSIGHDLHATLPCGQGTNASCSAREAGPGTGRNPSTSPPGSGATEGLGPTQPTPPKHESITGTVRPSSRHSGQSAQSSSGAPKVSTSSGSEVRLTDKALNGASGSPSEGQEAEATNDQATNLVSVHIPERNRSRAKLVLVSSGLSSNEQVIVKTFAKRTGCRVVSQVTAETTHIVMKTDGQLVCERTLKYFLGIAGRKWIVSFQWISECFQQGRVLDESPFEVRGDVVNGPNHQGPLRARTTEENNLLMKGYKICFQGPFTDMTTDQLEWMVELCGATVVKDPLLFDSKRKSHQLVIVQPGSEPSQSKYRALQRRATVVSRGWLLDTVSTYTLQSHGNYRL